MDVQGFVSLHPQSMQGLGLILEELTVSRSLEMVWKEAEVLE